MSSMEEVVEHLQGTLPRETVLDGARKLSTFVDAFKAHMRTAIDESERKEDGSIVVTKDMVEQVMAQMQAQAHGSA